MLLLYSDNEVHIHGYEIVRRDRKPNGRHGGGICIYIRNSINFSIRHDLSIDQLENLCISIKKHKSKPFLVLLLLLSHLFKRHASLTQQYAGLQEGRVQRKITRSIKLKVTFKST